jgi:demethylphylloquinone reductase
MTGMLVTEVAEESAPRAGDSAGDPVAGADMNGARSGGTNDQPGTAAADSALPSGLLYSVRLKRAGGSDGGGDAAASPSPPPPLPAHVVLWTAGSRASSQPLEPFPADARGQLETDATLRVLRHSRVFALGDVAGAGAGGAAHPATAQVAFQQADYAAWNLWSAINGRPLLPFRCGCLTIV